MTLKNVRMRRFKSIKRCLTDGETKMERKTYASIVIGLLLIGLMTCWQTWRSPLGAAHGSPDVVNIDTNLEYSNGTLTSRNPDLPFWYDWINVSGTEIIFLAYQSHVVNPPIITFLGQHYHAENETEVFIGNTLTSMEVYNDTNGNGLPDADYSKSSSEILYFFDVNSSSSAYLITSGACVTKPLTAS
jgi:hypothetical protein